MFGSVVSHAMCLSASGLLAQSVWTQLTEWFSGVLLDEFVLMPNHLHGIIILPPRLSSYDQIPTLGEVIRAFKAVTARSIRQSGLCEFAWQRNYHEHIVRDEQDLSRIQQYIANNPASWAEDEENPDAP